MGSHYRARPLILLLSSLLVFQFPSAHSSEQNSGLNWYESKFTSSTKFISKEFTHTAFSATGMVGAATTNGGGIWLTLNAGQNWHQSIPPDQDWSAIAVSQNGKFMAAATQNNGIWISHDSGITWNNSKTDLISITDISVNQDGSKAALVSKGHLWQSLDSGISWTQESQKLEGWEQTKYIGDGSALIGLRCDVQSDSCPLYRTNDNGATWQLLGPNGSSWTSMDISNDGRTVIGLVGLTSGSFSEAGIYVSQDGGNTWRRMRDAIPAPRVAPVGLGKGAVNYNSVSLSGDGTSLAVTVLGYGVVITRDLGANWQDAIYAQNSTWGVPAISSNGMNIFVEGAGKFNYSLDGGNSWKESTISGTMLASLNRNFSGLTTSFDGASALVGINGGRIWYSLDGAQHWSESDSPYFNQSYLSNSMDGKIAFAAGTTIDGNGNGVWKSVDSGRSWTSLRKTNSLWWSIKSSNDGTNLVGRETDLNYGNERIESSIDTGVNWSVLPLPYARYKNWGSVAISGNGETLIVSASNPSTLTSNSVQGQSSIFISHDRGATWVESHINLGSASNVEISNDATHIFVLGYDPSVSETALWVSTDSGITWSSCDSAIRNLALSSSADSLIAIHEYALIYASGDSCRTWTLKQVRAINNYSQSFIVMSGDSKEVIFAQADKFLVLNNVPSNFYSPTPTPVSSPTPTPVFSPTPTPVFSPTPTPTKKSLVHAKPTNFKISYVKRVAGVIKIQLANYSKSDRYQFSASGTFRLTVTGNGLISITGVPQSKKFVLTITDIKTSQTLVEVIN